MNDSTFGIPRRVWRLIYPAVLMVIIMGLYTFPVLLFASMLPHTKFYKLINLFYSTPLWVYSLSGAVVEAIAAIVIWLLIKNKIQKFKCYNMLKLLFVTVCFAVALSLIGTSVNSMIHATISSSGISQNTAASDFLSQILCIGVAGAILQEIVFRGVIFNRAASWLPQWAALLVSSAIFAAGHLELNRLADTFIMGLVFGFLYMRFRTLLLPSILHVIYNTTIIALPYFNQSVRVTNVAALKPIAGFLPILAPSILIVAVCIVIFMKLPKAEPITELIQNKAEPVVTPSPQTVEAITAAQQPK